MLLNYTSIMKKCLLLLIGLGVHLAAGAEIYKHVDSNGNVTYSNVPMKGATKLDLEPPVTSTSPPPRTKTPAPANFPRVDKSEQKQRDEKRRQILEEELAAERLALEEAKKNLAEGETDPEVFKTTVAGKDGKPKVVTRRNVAKYQEKMERLQENVALHEKNIELLEKEIAALK
jgi:hypothetical protein